MTPTRLDRPAPGGDAGVTRARLITVVREALEVGGVLLTAGPGYGKTTVLEQALSDGTRRVAWLSCTETERAEGTLLMRILDRVGRVAPGATDALAERLASAPEQVDAIAAARELVADLPRLLVDPLVLVIDDAEHLDGADRSLELLGELIGAALPAARVAVASRRPLGLHVAKVRASGRLAELGPADLAFDSEECAALLLERMGREPSAEEVGDVLAASEGWPLGIALATGRGPGNNEVIRGLRSAPEVRAFLSEELLDSLTPDLRAGAITSSVTRVVTPGVALALE